MFNKVEIEFLDVTRAIVCEAAIGNNKKMMRITKAGFIIFVINP